MPDIYCLCFDLCAECLFIKPLAEVAACNLLSISKSRSASCAPLVVGYTLSRDAAEQIIREKKLEALCKMSILCDAEHEALKEENEALKAERVEQNSAKLREAEKNADAGEDLEEVKAE